MDVFLEWNQDLLISPDGSLVMAQGWDEIRQRIIRRFLTNSGSPLPDGTVSAPDYIFDWSYGLNAGQVIDQNPSQQWLRDLKLRARAAVLSDTAVDPGSSPSIDITVPAPGYLLITITVRLSNGSTGTVTLTGASGVA